MADVRPFRGFRYTDPDLAAVVTPPYDVISGVQQADFYARNPHNIIRLEFGQTRPDDDHLENVYSRAAVTFAQWRLEGTLRQDTQPSFYVYKQDFTIAGESHSRTSLLAQVRLEPWDAGIILPHEKTLAKPKDDRLKLLRACAANLSPLMSLFDDPDQSLAPVLQGATASEPLEDFVTDDGERHRLWAITDVSTSAKIAEFFHDKQLFLADGHHRYETGLAYREEVRELHRGLLPDEAANFTLMALVATNDPGLVVLPTHRLVSGVAEAVIAALPTKLADMWHVEMLAHPSSAAELTAQLTAAREQGTSAVIVTQENTLLLTSTASVATRMQQTGQPEAWQKLDVAIAQELIIGDALSITAEIITTGDQLRYVRDSEDALQAVRDGSAQVAILLNPTQPGQVRDVAQAGGRMPQKSTYFYPKLITGAVINPVW